MGIDVFALNFLLRNRHQPLGDTLCLGRQGVHLQLEDERVISLAREQNKSIDEFRVMLGSSGFAEDLFISLGSAKVHSMDISVFEGANIIQDLNDPIPSSLANQYDCIFDGGTIEHVFNFPEAIKNVKSMLRVGGLYYFINAANNMLGHGLYQFSPELLWRLFSKESGFSVLDMKLVETIGNGNFVDAPDPESLGRRNEISITIGQTYLMMVARKDIEILQGADVYQSDYSRAWSKHSA